MDWKERQQRASAAMSTATIKDLGADLFAGNEEGYCHGFVPPEIFIVGVHELFTLLEECHRIVLSEDWHACFHDGWSSLRNDAALREYRILEALDVVYVNAPTERDAASVAEMEKSLGMSGKEWSKKCIADHLADAEEAFFEKCDPRWVRVFKGEATPEEEAEVRAIVKQQEEESHARHLARRAAGKLREPIDRAEENRRFLRHRIEIMQRRLAEMEANPTPAYDSSPGTR